MRLTVFLSLVLFLGSCSTNSKQQDEFPPPVLYFGSGGGYAGQVHSYRLTEDGELIYSDPFKKEDIELKGMRKRAARKLFKEFRALSPCDGGAEAPGNTYSFVQLEENGAQCGWTWGEPESEAKEEVKAIYQQLMDQVKEKE